VPLLVVEVFLVIGSGGEVITLRGEIQQEVGIDLLVRILFLTVV
jgi:hypothetical protein